MAIDFCAQGSELCGVILLVVIKLSARELGHFVT